MLCIRMCLIAVLSAVPIGTASAQDGQWGLSAEIGFARFGGNSEDTSTADEVSGRPSGGTTFAFRIDHERGGIRIALGLLYFNTGLEISGPLLAVSAKDQLKLLELAPEVALRIFRVGQGVARLHGGLVIDRWSPKGGDARTVLGGTVGVSLEVPLSSRMGVQIRWDAALTRSILQADEIPVEFDLRKAFRNRLGLGLRYRL